MRHNKHYSFLLVVILGGIFYFVPILRAQSSNIIINEIAWMGTTTSINDEWIELYNDSEQAVNLTDWTLKAIDGTPNIVLSGIIEANSYFLLERTDDSSVPDIAADQIYTGNLNNSGEYLQLKNSQGVIINEIDANNGWPAGDNTTKQTMERTASNSWQTSMTIGGTPKALNSNNETISESEPQPEAVYSPSDIVINEFVSDAVTGEKEWIELYFPPDKDGLREVIDLTGWTIEDGVGKILTLNGNLASNGFIVFELNSAKLNNSGDIIILKDLGGNIIDQVTYGSWDDGNTEDNAPAANDPDSVVRLIDGVDTNIDNVDFAITTTPTKGTANVNNANEQDDPTTLSNEGSFSMGGVPGSVVINEIVSDPEDGPEWIELYNKTNFNIDLAGWHLEEGSEAQTDLSETITGHGYLVIEGPKGNLNNSGDIIILYDNYNNIIDQVTYGSWDDGNLNDNAPKTNDPYSLGRIGNSQDTNNDLTDFQTIATPTKGAANILFIEEEQELVSDLKNKIIINEILPNPAGSDESEFIELKNISEQEIDLDGLIIGDNSKRRYKIKDCGGTKSCTLKLPAGALFVVLRSTSKIALNNTGGDKVVLYDQQENIIDEIEYTVKAPEGKSYARVGASLAGAPINWRWTDQPTAGEENIFLAENQPPVAVIDLEKSEVLLGEEIILDASDSYDPEGKNLIMEWQIQKTTNNIQLYHNPILQLSFDEAGSYEVKLKVSDGEMATVEQVLINAVSAENPASTLEVGLPNRASFNLINEFQPNPEGSDEAEFIELYNPEQTAIDLSGFYLDDQEGGSKPYQIPKGIILEPAQYLVFGRQETKLTLNNTTDTVRLLNENKNVLQQVNYSNVVEGASYAKALDDSWHWTEIITAGKENQIVETRFIASKQNRNLINKIELNKIRNLDFSDIVKVRGIVSAEPGILGSQIFYIQPPSIPPDKGGWGVNAGIQIYSYKKDFPELKIGDEIEVVGTLSQNRGETRLKIKQQEDIQIIKNNRNDETQLRPAPVPASEIGEDLEGSLVQVIGEIIEIKGSSIFLDDGSDEVKVYLKKTTGIKKNFQEGDIITVAGIVSQTSTGYRLLPRYQDDIKKTQVLGAELEPDNSDIIIEPRSNEWLKYLTATLGAVVLILLIVNLRMWRQRS
jgi:hypothetical protein